MKKRADNKEKMSLEQIIQLQDDITALDELLHEHLNNRELYRAAPDVWRLAHLNYREQLDTAEAQLAYLLRECEGRRGPMPDGQHA